MRLRLFQAGKMDPLPVDEFPAEAPLRASCPGSLIDLLLNSWVFLPGLGGLCGERRILLTLWPDRRRAYQVTKIGSSIQPWVIVEMLQGM